MFFQNGNSLSDMCNFYTYYSAEPYCFYYVYKSKNLGII